MSIVVPIDNRSRYRGPDPTFLRLAAQEDRVQQRAENTKHYDRPVTQDMLDMGMPEDLQKQLTPKARRQVQE